MIVDNLTPRSYDFCLKVTVDGGYSEIIPGLKFVVEELETYLLEKKNDSMIYIEAQFNNTY